MGHKPSSLHVGHMSYDIDYNDEANCDELAADGFTHEGTRRIGIRPTLHPDYEREVLLHDALHACVDVTRLGLSYKAEERIVDHLTGPLLDLIRRNPELIRFLQQ